MIEFVRNMSLSDGDACVKRRSGTVNIADSTNFGLAFPFQPDCEFMSGLGGPTSGIVSWVIRGTLAALGYSTGNDAEGTNIPIADEVGDGTAASTASLRLDLVSSIDFTTVSDAVLSLWSPLRQGTGGALMDVQPLKITIT